MGRWSHSHLASLAVALALLQAASSEHWLNNYFTTDHIVRTSYDASGQQVAMVSLDQHTGGSGFQSKNAFLFGDFSIKMKLIPGNSANIVSTFYLASGDGNDVHRDEVDMEFLGNSSGQPVVLSTNIYLNGSGNREIQFNLWFDPAADYHTYTIIWNPENIIFKVDNDVIRSFKRYADLPYANSKPMAVHGSLWDGSNWPTAQSKIPIDWSHGPFTITYRDYFVSACIRGRKCPAASAKWMNKQPSKAELGTNAWVRQNYLRYDYCQDRQRFPQGLPGECSRN